jgi:Coenzyme PQQ synthesis protein D (PqqD)
MLNSDPKIRRRNGVETRPLPQGAVLVDMETGQCYRLNRVGAEIWSMLEIPSALHEICEGVAARYGRLSTSIEHEVRELVDHLKKEQLIEPVS